MKKIKLLRVIFLDTGIIESKRTSIYSSFRLSVSNVSKCYSLKTKENSLRNYSRKVAKISPSIPLNTFLSIET